MYRTNNVIIQYRPRVVLLEERGKLRGLVTVKDVLKYTARKESVDSPSVPHYSRECGGIFGKFSSWINSNNRGNPYSQLQNRSSIDVRRQDDESHELDNRL